jgi:putative tricarboxylic transport membrane protein
MARQGRAGPALGIAAFGSFIAGTIGIVGLMLTAPPLAEMALKFGPPEYAALMILGLTIVTYLSRGPAIKSIIMGLFGFGLAQMGMDLFTGHPRFTFGIMELDDGVGLIPLAMGLFGIAEVLTNLEDSTDVDIFRVKIKGLLPTLQDWKDCQK